MSTKKLAVAAALVFFHGMGAVSAAGLDDEMARISAEQSKADDRVEIFDPNPEPAVTESTPRTAREIREEQKRLEEERKAARKKIEEERKKSRAEITGKTPVTKNPAPTERIRRTPVIAEPVETKAVEPEPEPVVEVEPEPEPVGIPNPIVTYASFEEIVGAMNFTPLYVPKKSGYTISAISSIDRVAEIRYGRRWEPTVSLHIRTRTPVIAEPVETKPAEPEPEPVVEVEPEPEPVGIPNPIVTYASFEEIVGAMNFTPLYVPKKSGYTISAISSIDRVAEIRYGRRWEPTVSLHIRTYRRGLGEELRDISGVNGVKWRINVANGINIYIAKIDENRHVAAWAVGNYTFSAYVENLSFAAFHSFVADELVDLSQHYYLVN